jgi:hypothetical protein
VVGELNLAPPLDERLQRASGALERDRLLERRLRVELLVLRVVAGTI